MNYERQDFIGKVVMHKAAFYLRHHRNGLFLHGRFCLTGRKILVAVVTALFICGTVHADMSDTAGAVPEYTIIREEHPGVGKTHGSMSYFSNVLELKEYGIEIKLCDDFTEDGESYGLNKDSLRLTRINGNRLLWISFDTIAHGSGGISHTTDILVLFKNREVTEILRETYQNHNRLGWQAEVVQERQFNLGNDGHLVKMINQNTSVADAMDFPTLQPEKVADYYFYAWTFIEKITYTLHDNSLSNPKIETYLDLGSKKVLASDVVKALARQTAHKDIGDVYPVLPEDKANPENEEKLLLQLGCDKEDMLTGRVKFKPDGGELFSTEKGNIL